MRTSTLSSFLQGVRAMQRVQAQVSDTQQQLASGRRIQKASDDPSGVSNAVILRDSMSRLDQYDRNANSARTRLEYEESALQAVNDALQRVRELSLRANNATQTTENRRQIAIELRERLSDLVQIANQKDGSGRYLFSGAVDGTAPVSAVGGGYAYNGDETQRLIQIGESRRVFDGDSGADVFFSIRNGNGAFRVTADAANTGTGVLGAGTLIDPTAYDQGSYTVSFVDPSSYEVRDATSTVIATGTFAPGEAIEFQGVSFVLDGTPQAGDAFALEPSQFQNLFQTVSNLADAIELDTSTPASTAQLNTAINLGLQELDLALENVSEVRTRVGIRLNAIDAQTNSNGDVALLAQQALSELEDLDYAEAISRLTAQTATLEASQASFARVQQLSLFNYI